MFTDFETYLKDNPEANIWEMDTVIGSQGGKCLLTLLYRKTNLMIAILLEKHTQEAVIDALNNICDAIGIRLFQKYFEAILTDRGTEFSNPLGIECDANGEFKTRLFYCDSYCSWQKGTIERNHELIRQILPKGKSFDRFSQEDIDLMMNHINNYPRESLNDNSPYELSKLLLDKRILEALGIHKIKKDDVVLKPSLLKRNPYIIK